MGVTPERKLTYKRYAIAYIDILGTKKAIESLNPKDLIQRFNNVFLIEKAIIENDLFNEKHKSVKVKIFSDNICIAVEIKDSEKERLSIEPEDSDFDPEIVFEQTEDFSIDQPSGSDDASGADSIPEEEQDFDMEKNKEFVSLTRYLDTFVTVISIRHFCRDAALNKFKGLTRPENMCNMNI